MFNCTELSTIVDSFPRVLRRNRRREPFDKAFNEAFDNLWESFFYTFPESSSKPPSSIKEVFDEDENFIGARLQVALAGFTKEDIQVSANNNTLKVEGDKNKNGKEINQKFLCTFSWEIALREGLDISKMEGSLENGLLSIFIPVREKEKENKVTLQLK